MLAKLIFSLTTCLGFGILLDIKGRNLIYTSFIGFFGWTTFEILKTFHWNILLVYFFSTCLVTFLAELISRNENFSIISLIVPPLIPLAPGTAIYYTFFYFFNGQIDDSLNKALETLSRAILMAIAILITNFIFIIKDKIKFFYNKNKEIS